MTEGEVDVIIPVHSTERPVEEAVQSADSPRQGIATRILVVLHNVTEEHGALIRRRMPPSVKTLICNDGISSPSGPRNVGIDAATAPSVFFLDSDDQLAPGCLQELVAVAEEMAAGVVLPAIYVDERRLPAPLTGPRHSGLVDIERNHLYLRSQSVSLVRTAVLRRTGIRYPWGVKTGEDLVFMAQLYASTRTALASDAHYLARSGASDRITEQTLSFDERFEGLRLILRSPWFAELEGARRDLLAHRLLAVNLAGTWRFERTADRRRLRSAYVALRDEILLAAPGARAFLSVRDITALRFEPVDSPWESALRSSLTRAIPTTVRGAIHPAGPLRSSLTAASLRYAKPHTGSALSG